MRILLPHCSAMSTDMPEKRFRHKFKGLKAWVIAFFQTFLSVFLLCSCSSLPPMNPVVSPLDRDMATKSQTLFPTGTWQLVHAIEAVPPNGEKMVFTGVSVVSDSPPSLRCVLMTQEGFVLFEGVYEKELTIRRALPPFDKPGFAEGLIDDVRLVLMKPDSAPADCGRFDDASLGCRYREPAGRTTDIAMTADGSWLIRRYNASGRLTRTVTAASPGKGRRIDGVFFPDWTKLTCHGMLGYTLTLTLVDAFHHNP